MASRRKSRSSAAHTAGSPFSEPELMAIGDSLPQGCRSLSVTAAYCEESYLARCARLLRLPFRSPRHPRPVLFDLEAIAGDVIFQGIPAVLGGLEANYGQWLQDFDTASSDDLFFDNLAVAGFSLEDTLGLPFQSNGTTPGFGTPELAEAWLKKTPDLDLRKEWGLLSDLHQAVNARYVLNPSNHRSRRTWSQLDWVEQRQPKNLVVHLGHNNGLYAIGADGDITGWQKNWSSPLAPGPIAYRAILDRLAASLKDTNVVVIGLPKVGAVANLMPLGPARLSSNPDYFARYETQFPFRKEVAGEMVCAADADITRVNQDIAQHIAGLPKFTYFSAFDFFALLDTKNTGETPVRIGRYTIDNFYIDGAFRRQPGRPATPRYRWEFERGGLLSIDGMHPTSIGYALLAFEIYRLLKGQPLPQAQRDQHLRETLLDERLVSQFPQGLDFILRILAKYRHPNQSEDEQAFCQTIRGASHVVW